MEATAVGGISSSSSEWFGGENFRVERNMAASVYNAQSHMGKVEMS